MRSKDSKWSLPELSLSKSLVPFIKNNLSYNVSHKSNNFWFASLKIGTWNEPSKFAFEATNTYYQFSVDASNDTFPFVLRRLILLPWNHNYHISGSLNKVILPNDASRLPCADLKVRAPRLLFTQCSLQRSGRSSTDNFNIFHCNLSSPPSVTIKISTGRKSAIISFFPVPKINYVPQQLLGTHRAVRQLQIRVRMQCEVQAGICPCLVFRNAQ